MSPRRQARAPSTRSRSAAWILAAALFVVAGCAPAAAPGSATLAPVDRSGVWTVRVGPTQVGRALLVRHGLLRSVVVPREHVPPPGTCRIWRAGLAPARQSPVGACGVLERQAPAGSYLIYG